MDSFHWDSNFETGHGEVDRQHLHLVGLINRFGELLAENRASIDDIEILFNELADYAQYHFQEEEELMQLKHVDERHVIKHLKSHNSFLNEVNALRGDITPKNIESAKHLLSFLTHWLVYHILGSDQDMARQIQAIDNGLSPSQAFDKEEHERDKATEPLLAALSGLFEQVSERNHALQELNQSLERKVEERTHALQLSNKRLIELSLTDSLTGLPNRRSAIKRLNVEWENSEAVRQPLVCMMIDADHFKEVNDTYGHDAGDQVLKELATALRHALRTDDWICRLGGDEFFVICSDTDLNGGIHIAEKILEHVNTLTVQTGGEPWRGSTSIGVATRTAGMENYRDLMKAADDALYAAKAAGKNCVRASTEQFRITARRA